MEQLHCISGRKQYKRGRDQGILSSGHQATHSVHTTPPLCFLFDIFEDGEDSYERHPHVGWIEVGRWDNSRDDCKHIPGYQ